MGDFFNVLLGILGAIAGAIYSILDFFSSNPTLLVAALIFGGLALFAFLKLITGNIMAIIVAGFVGAMVYMGSDSLEGVTTPAATVLGMAVTLFLLGRLVYENFGSKNSERRTFPVMIAAGIVLVALLSGLVGLGLVPPETVGTASNQTQSFFQSIGSNFTNGVNLL